MSRFASFRMVICAAAFGSLGLPVEACTLLEPSSAAEAAQWRQEEVDWHANRMAGSWPDAEVVLFGKVIAVRPTEMADQMGGPIRYGWREIPAFRIWFSPEVTLQGEAPEVFSVYWGVRGDTCRTWGGFKEGKTALVVARRPYAGGHWFGEIVGGDDLDDLLPALAVRGINLGQPPP